jgi:hypothetical protein
LPTCAPDPCAPPCIRQRFFPETAGDRHACPERVRAPQRGLDNIGTVLRGWLDTDGPGIQKADWSASRRLSRVLDPFEDLSPQKTGLGLRINRSALPSAPPKAPSLAVVAADNCCPVLFARAQEVTWACAAKIQLGPWSKPQFTAFDVSTLHGVVVPKCGNIARALDSDDARFCENRRYFFSHLRHDLL